MHEHQQLGRRVRNRGGNAGARQLERLAVAPQLHLDREWACGREQSIAEDAVQHGSEAIEQGRGAHLLERRGEDGKSAVPTGTDRLSEAAEAATHGKIAAAFSAIMMVGALVLPPMSRGMIEASTTRRPSTPRTRRSASTTALASLPMRQVPAGW